MKAAKLDWYLAGGVLLGLWAAMNTYLDISRYGIEQGFYWWFCNLALIGVAGGLLFKHRGWLTGFLSIACFTQIFWVFDNNYRVLTGQNLFGLVEFMYQPGLPLDEFLLSHYHYFTIPVALIALIHLPQKENNTLTLIAIFNPLIFAVSYFGFPATQNVNCIHEPCFPGLVQWAGLQYSLLFWAAVFAVHLLIGWRLNRFLLDTPFSLVFKKRALGVFTGVCALALSLAAVDTRYRLSLPKFTCTAESPPGVSVSCGFTLDYSPQKMLFVYRLKNETALSQSCSVFLRQPGKDGKDFPLQAQVPMAEYAKKRLETVLPYPEQDVAVVLHAQCDTEPSRAVTAEP